MNFKKEYTWSKFRREFIIVMIVATSLFIVIRVMGV